MNAASIVDSATGVLLDFDGPVCSIFANLPAPGLAEDLRQVLRHHDVAISEEIARESDPMEMLRHASRVSAKILADVDNALRSAELEAAKTAEPTPGADQVMRHVADRMVPLIIVSNNSAPAIRLYLDDHGLTRYVRGIVGRSFARPDLMKPDPSPLIRGIELIGSRSGGCVIIGDSVADITAARRARVASIGYANRPGKRQALAQAGADAIIDSMAELLDEART